MESRASANIVANVIIVRERGTNSAAETADSTDCPDNQFISQAHVFTSQMKTPLARFFLKIDIRVIY
jgi:hypothetical protein